MRSIQSRPGVSKIRTTRAAIESSATNPSFAGGNTSYSRKVHSTAFIAGKMFTI